MQLKEKELALIEMLLRLLKISQKMLQEKLLKLKLPQNLVVLLCL